MLLAGLMAGCRVARKAADVPVQAVRAVTPGKKQERTLDPVSLQQTVYRLTDEMSGPVVVGIENLRRGDDALDPAAVLRWKIAFGTTIASLATGPNAVANVLDLTVFVSVIRTALQDQWQPEIFGASAQPMLEAIRVAETNAWRLAATILEPEQQAELRESVAAYGRQNLPPETALATRAVGFASLAAQARPVVEKPGSVFGLLNLDPLSSLDPATRELAQARLLGDRALYLALRMPTLLRWQTELLALNTAALPALPAVQQVVTNSSHLTFSMGRFATVAEQLPGQLRAEREQILGALKAQEGDLAILAGEIRQTLAAGSGMSASLNVTLKTFDALMQRFGVGETNTAATPDAAGEPFRIEDYRLAAAQLEATARQLTELLVSLDRTVGSNNLSQLSARVVPVIQQAQAGGREVVDYAF